MPPMVQSVRWNATDEEKANGIIAAPAHTRSNTNKNDKLRRRASQRSIDPAAAIPIEYRSLSVPAMFMKSLGH